VGVPPLVERISKPALPKAAFEDGEDCYELVEWLDLVTLDSSRVTPSSGGQPDSYISRYTLPEGSLPRDVRVVEWQGLLSSKWMTKLLIETM